MTRICSGCGSAERYYAKALCKPCYDRRWRAAWRLLSSPKVPVLCSSCNGNPNQLAQRQPPLCKTCWQREHLANTPSARQARAATSRRWRQAHIEQVRLLARIRTQKWQRLNRAKVQDRKRRRYAQKMGARFETVELQIVFDRDLERCHICGKRVHRSDASMDHIWPLSRGGEHSYDNVRLTHRSCNSRRWANGPAQLSLSQRAT